MTATITTCLRARRVQGEARRQTNQRRQLERLRDRAERCELDGYRDVHRVEQVLYPYLEDRMFRQRIASLFTTELVRTHERQIAVRQQSAVVHEKRAAWLDMRRRGSLHARDAHLAYMESHLALLDLYAQSAEEGELGANMLAWVHLWYELARDLDRIQLR